MDRRGRILTFDLSIGEQLSGLTVWGTNRNQLWLGTYPDDDILRVYIDDQLTGLNLKSFTGLSCPE